MPTRNLPAATGPTELLVHLIEVLHDTKRTRVKEILREGLVHVNGDSVTRHDHKITPSDVIQIRDERVPPARQMPFPVLFEDAHMLAIHKPCGLLTIATDNEKTKTVYHIANVALGSTRERAYIVHRLDRFTSGVLLLAKTEEAKSRIMGNWKAATKRYHALVEGSVRPAEGKLQHHLREDERLVVTAMDRPTRDSQHATLYYRTVRGGRALTLLEIELDTGRKNQIRAQLAAVGHPIAGDAKYGAESDPIRRLCLHASSLSIPHPMTGEMLLFEAPMPRDMERAAG